MALEVTYRQGSPLFVDYTPSGAAVNAGQVVVVGELPCVAHAAIADGKKGALAAGGGVYKCTGDGALAAGAGTTSSVRRDVRAGVPAPGDPICWLVGAALHVRSDVRTSFQLEPRWNIPMFQAAAEEWPSATSAVGWNR